jgi:serine/threonine-protein kinase
MSAATSPDSSLPRPFVSTSRYRLVKQIASGGMGSVYAGFQCGAAGFERPVAIKRAHPHVLADVHARRMILREARHASLVRHPSVVSIDDVEDVDGELLLVMDYVEGTSLSHLRESAMPMTVGVALRIAIDIAMALEAIHGATSETGEPLALVHRDISPQNVLVGVDGLARVTDFGIAKSAHDRKQTLGAGRRGKLGYMSPEYLRTACTSASSDLFAFGVVLWEMLAGRRLFAAADPDADCQELANARSAVRLETVRSDVPGAIDDFVQKTLASAVVDRFPDVVALRMALESAAQGMVASRERVAAHVAAVAGPAIAELRRELRASDSSDKHSSDALPIPPPLRVAPATQRPSPGLHTGLKGDGLMDLVARCSAALDAPRRPRARSSDAEIACLLKTARPIAWPQAPRRSLSGAIMRGVGIAALAIMIVAGTAALVNAGLEEEASSSMVESRGAAP